MTSDPHSGLKAKGLRETHIQARYYRCLYCPLHFIHVTSVCLTKVTFTFGLMLKIHPSGKTKKPVSFYPSPAMLILMKRIFIVSLLSLFLQNAQGQFNETVRTDRPGQAIGPFSVGKLIFQTQTGIDIGGLKEKKNNFSNYSMAPSTVLRLGITRRFEINTALEYRRDNFNINAV